MGTNERQKNLYSYIDTNVSPCLNSAPDSLAPKFYDYQLYSATRNSLATYFRNDTKEFKNEEIVCTDVWSPDSVPRTSILRRSISKHSEEDI